ncbi:inward rectifier potassium channel 4-like [Mizuhopecten yessoensis]|uniref:ATP-sensitive inward rectifier potassium channel 12 n=1 Tax=Mizuhopecten yessoensis TaxID=6573 RepID=A0A210PUB5_MIZYE|nr:inward rectifier potassium channel 4-like [Mizuhopecten yessoensis]XP_021375036.1 inward rectifier potassium channel 4-like [Mizuhopecten yessoensis]XP_021375037.1 inward rectifier potassium channel 4-like [Mizuhopecten yessoensis]XP_021375038.1 inward rectifier potassium channel 4-like [Mizuhopecten yessoensis]OWF40090.1 ATP-sensitive inward rectifier potassium channel 12 [Mizuhopecten yessoensis]
MTTTTGVTDSNPIRLVSSSGVTNIKCVGISGRRIHFFTDFFTSMIEIKWSWNVIIFIGGFTITWLLFGLYYWFVCHLHGDFVNYATKDWNPCITNVKSFVSTFLFSIETQTTIGYGSRSVTEECPVVYLGIFIQSIVGAGLQAALAGLVVAKIRRAKKRARTILFSTVACIVEEDDQMKLVIRVGDMRKSFILNVQVKGYFFQKMAAQSGKSYPVKYHPMTFKGEDSSLQIFLAWPTQLVHVIDEKSPLWTMSREDLKRYNCELVIILDGTVASTNMPFQAQTSYLPWDILWGHRFDTLGTKVNKSGAYILNFANFHKTHALTTPVCSARGLRKMIDAGLPVPKECPRESRHSQQSLSPDELVVRFQSADNDAYEQSTPAVNSRELGFDNNSLENSAFCHSTPNMNSRKRVSKIFSE